MSADIQRSHKLSGQTASSAFNNLFCIISMIDDDSWSEIFEIIEKDVILFINVFCTATLSSFLIKSGVNYKTG